MGAAGADLGEGVPRRGGLAVAIGPQQATGPLVRTPQVWSLPALTEAVTRPSSAVARGMPSSEGVAWATSVTASYPTVARMATTTVTRRPLVPMVPPRSVGSYALARQHGDRSLGRRPLPR
ncbi:MAG: hypothetical protein M3011_09655 [Actinomycetota bacterium]|nr:hypothetical protein [Actinomycetota bacterium]